MNNVTQKFLTALLLDLRSLDDDGSLNGRMVLFGRLSRVASALYSDELNIVRNDLTELVRNSSTELNEPTSAPSPAKPDKDWELFKHDVSNKLTFFVRRLEVPGGWLYQVSVANSQEMWHPPTFVPAQPHTMPPVPTNGPLF